jgi:hypothetical protein
MRRFREPVGTGSEPVTDRFRQPVPGGGLYRPPEPVPRVQPEGQRPCRAQARGPPMDQSRERRIWQGRVECFPPSTPLRYTAPLVERKDLADSNGPTTKGDKMRQDRDASKRSWKCSINAVKP